MLVTFNATIHIVAESIVAKLCEGFRIMPDFCSYLCRLGPFTQDNLEYNSFRNRKINFSSAPAYGRSWSDWEQSPDQEHADPSSLQQTMGNHTLEVCYLLKLPRLTTDAGTEIAGAFGIAHMAEYCHLGLKSSLCVIMEDSTHALDTRKRCNSRMRDGCFSGQICRSILHSASLSCRQDGGASLLTILKS